MKEQQLSAQRQFCFDCLLLAAADRDTRSIRGILAHESTRDLFDRQKLIALSDADVCKFGEIVTLLLNRKAAVDFLNKKSGFTALHMVAMDGYGDLVELLLNRKANIEYATHKSGFTALHMAAVEGHEKIVALLLNRKANVNAVDKGGESILGFAVYEGEWLQKAGSMRRICELLLDRGADVNARQLGRG